MPCSASTSAGISSTVTRAPSCSGSGESICSVPSGPRSIVTVASVVTSYRASCGPTLSSAVAVVTPNQRAASTASSPTSARGSHRRARPDDAEGGPEVSGDGSGAGAAAGRTSDIVPSVDARAGVVAGAADRAGGGPVC